MPAVPLAIPSFPTANRPVDDCQYPASIIAVGGVHRLGKKDTDTGIFSPVHGRVEKCGIPYPKILYKTKNDPAAAPHSSMRDQRKAAMTASASCMHSIASAKSGNEHRGHRGAKKADNRLGRPRKVISYSARVTDPHWLGLVLIRCVPLHASCGMYSVPGQG